MYKTLKSPLAVQLEITDNCNQVCSHCYRACQNIRKQKVVCLTPTKIEMIIEKLSAHEVFQVCFTGGEPLMYKEVLSTGIVCASKRGIFPYVNSNLQLLSPQIIDLFKDHEVNVLTSLLSFDGKIHDEIVKRKGAFGRLVKNINLLTCKDIKISANMVVRKENCHQIYETGKLAYELGIRRFSATKVAPSPGTNYEQYRASADQIKNSLDALLRLKEDFGIEVEILESYPLCFFRDIKKYFHFAKRNCTAGILNCSISPNGDVRPCSHADMNYGNLFERSLSECWLSMNEWRDGSLLNDECKKCDYLLQCSGGCRMDAKLHSGDIKGVDPLMTNSSNIVPLQSTRAAIDLPDTLLVYSNARMRSEDFGGIITLNYDVVLLSQQGYGIIKKIKDLSSFQWKEIDIPGLSPGKKEIFFSVLFKKGILRKA